MPDTPSTRAWPPSLPSDTDLARHARDFRRKRGELVDHRVDGVLQLQHLALDVDGDLLGEDAAGDGGGDGGDVADLAGEVAGHRVDRVGQILPRARHAFDARLAAQLAFGADLARHARDLRGERPQLIDHRVDGVLQLEELALHVDGNLLGEVAVGDGRGHLGDVADLGRQVAGHQVDVVGEVLPGPGDAADLRLTGQLAFGADLARHARDLRGKRPELVDHRVDGDGGAAELAFERAPLGLERHGLRQVALGDGANHARHLGRGMHQVVNQRVDRVNRRGPRPADVPDAGALRQPALASDGVADAFQLEGHALVHRDDLVEGVGELALDAGEIGWKSVGEVALSEGHQALQQVAGDG